MKKRAALLLAAAACSPQTSAQLAQRPTTTQAGLNSSEDSSSSGAEALTATTEAPEETTTTLVLPTTPPTTVALPPVTVPRTVAPVTTWPYNGTATISDVEWLVRQTWPEQPDFAASVAECESGFNPGAVSPGGHVGVMQLSPIHAGRAARLGYAWSDMYDAAPNLAVARNLYDEQGWRPWSCA